MQVLSGKLVAESLKTTLLARSKQFQTRFGRKPNLVVLLVGDNPASHVYVRNKEKACASVEFDSKVVQLPGSTGTEQLIQAVQKLNQDDQVDGILVQLPLPKGVDENKVINSIHPTKDVDCLGQQTLGGVWAGTSAIAPCTPKGVMHILRHFGISVDGKKAVVIGRSMIVGKPMANLLLGANATVTICHSKTKNLREELKDAEIVVVAIGRERFLGKDDFMKGAVVVDVGIHGSGQPNAKVCGDVRFDELDGWASAATPVPGGVGPMTIASLLENTLILAEQRNSNR